MIWFDDFPISPTKSPINSEFKTDLIHLIDSFGISGKFLHRYDFSSCKVKVHHFFSSTLSAVYHIHISNWILIFLGNLNFICVFFHNFNFIPRPN